MTLSEIISHDLLQSSPIFDGDIPAKSDKAKLLEDIEHHLSKDSWCYSSSLKTHVFYDFMSKIRHMNLSNHSTFSEVIQTVIVSAKRVCTSELLHVVLDSYCEMSLKEGERLRRSNVQPLDIVTINETVPIPKQQKQFSNM